jgi:hypothetical protein
MESKDKKTIAALQQEIERLKSNVQDLETEIAINKPYHINNVLMASTWAELHADCISNSAVRYLIMNGEIDGMLFGRYYIVFMTEKTREYQKSNRGPVHTSQRKLEAMERAQKVHEQEVQEAKEKRTGKLLWDSGIQYQHKNAS